MLPVSLLGRDKEIVSGTSFHKGKLLILAGYQHDELSGVFVICVHPHRTSKNRIDHRIIRNILSFYDPNI
jgi:hypothetical protein